jgi:peptide/nickel transport system permease protein
MVTAGNSRDEILRRRLLRLDLYCHSLRLMAHKLASGCTTSSTAPTGAMYERSLELGSDCSEALRLLRERLDLEDTDACESTGRLVDLAVQRASRAEGHVPFAVNVWRVVEAVEGFLERVAAKYGYTTLSRRTEMESAPGPGAVKAPFSPPLALHEETGLRGSEKALGLSLPAFRTGPRWRAGRILRPGLLSGIVLVLAFVAVALAAPVIAPPEGKNPYTMPRASYSTQPEPPRPGHPLGTTESSFDVFYGLVWGTHIALRVGISVTVGRVIIGVVLGLVSGYYGGWLDAVIMRITDAFMAFPVVPAALVLLVLLAPTRLGRVGAGSGVNSIIVISLILFGWMQYSRLVRGNVLVERAKQYVEAAVATGARGSHIIWRHILPNVPQGVFVLVASDVGAMVVLAAVFTFLGLSGSSGLADWGWLLYTSRNWIIGTPSNAFQYWYTYLPPIAAILLFSAGWNLVGDGLRDVLDPRV